MSAITISAPTTGTQSVKIEIPETSTILSEYLNQNRSLAVSIPYGGTDINLTSMGKYPSGSTNSVWRLRNGTTTLVSSTLSAYKDVFSAGYDLPANTDTFVVSPIFTTHILTYVGGSRTKAAGSQTFTYGYDISPQNASNTNYTLVGGGGNDTLIGTSKADILVGKGGNDNLYLGNDNAADIVSYQYGDGSDTIYNFVKDGANQDLLSFTGAKPFNIDVVTKGTNTELRQRSGSFGQGDLLATIVGVTGFAPTDLGVGGDNLAPSNTATFFFS